MSTAWLEDLRTGRSALPDGLVPWQAAFFAVFEAGDILRQGFHESGRNETPGKSPYDAMAEAAIRRRLEQAWPDDACIGEELDDHLPDTARRQWIIDPNDGTRAYQHGWRGSAVSLALYERGRPQFAMVHAPLWPDDHGTTIVWAAGGPVMHDGRIVTHERIRAARERGMVLLSQGADRYPENNLEVLEGRRWQAMPSIALRLALVAAGVAAAGVSLAAPTSWDLAAGLALLRASGLDLFDGCGQPVRIGPDGELMPGVCYSLFVGGDPELCRRLLEVPWSRVRRAAARSTGLLDDAPVAPPPRGEGIREAGRLDRACGCLLGQLCGDALGSRVEFLSADEIARRHPDGGPRDMIDGGVWRTLAGQPTDDSELALLLARHIVRHGRYTAGVLLDYQHWLRSAPFDVGNTIRQALTTGDASTDSEANGALMRISPLGIFGWRLPRALLADLARFDSALTHASIVCQDANAVFVVLLADLIRDGVTPGEAYARLVDRHLEELDISAPVRERVLRAAEQCPVADGRHRGWVLIALQQALYRLLHQPDPGEAIVQTVRAGGDTDTNAAIAGALLGAAHGARALPADWIHAVESCRPWRGDPRARHPRPRAFWPADARRLAEHLLIVGRHAAAGLQPETTEIRMEEQA